VWSWGWGGGRGGVSSTLDRGLGFSGGDNGRRAREGRSSERVSDGAGAFCWMIVPLDCAGLTSQNRCGPALSSPDEIVNLSVACQPRAVLPAGGAEREQPECAWAGAYARVATASAC